MEIEWKFKFIKDNIFHLILERKKIPNRSIRIFPSIIVCIVILRFRIVINSLHTSSTTNPSIFPETINPGRNVKRSLLERPPILVVSTIDEIPQITSVSIQRNAHKVQESRSQRVCPWSVVRITEHKGQKHLGERDWRWIYNDLATCNKRHRFRRNSPTEIIQLLPPNATRSNIGQPGWNCIYIRFFLSWTRSRK